MSPLIWLVTGCSSGLGEVFVQEALSRGDQVIATARNGASRLQHLADAGAHTLDLDVTASQEELNSKVNEAAAKLGRIDVLINNAGYMAAGASEESSDEHFQSVFDVNFFGVLRMTRAVLPHMRKQRSGFVAFLGSPLGWRGVPGAAPYVATKFALEGIAECIWGEVASFGILVTMFDIGNLKTPILNDGRLKYSARTIDDYNEMMDRFHGIIGYLNDKQPGDPKKAIKVIADVIKAEGIAEGKTPPERLVLGTDMLGYVQNKCEETMASCKKWDAVTHSINFDGLAAPDQSQAEVVSSKLMQ